jgi:membrane fusion protein (multidrug efflux system)
VGFSAGTGAAFALLPAQNATGNWIKVVQRVPVRIQLNPQDIAAHPLQVGLSMRVEIAIRDLSGPRLPQLATDAPGYRTTVYEDAGKAADDRIKAVIAANSGSR